MKEKEKIIKKLKEYNKITLTSICREKGIRSENLIKGSTTLDNMIIVKNELQKRILKWLSEDE